MKEAEKKYYAEIKNSLNSKDKNIVRAKIKELKSKGHATHLPLLLDLLNTIADEEIKQDVLTLLGELREQKCAPIITDYIAKNHANTLLTEILASCWQSRLDYSAHLDTFADCFITGTYQSAIECFTVIEEMVWKSSETAITECRVQLLKSSNEMDELKKSLFHELIKVLESSRSQNSEEYPE